jgi:Flp pilus assembly protein TadG
MRREKESQPMRVYGDHQGLPGKILPQVLQPTGGSRGLRSEEGQAIIILTVAMIVFVALLGLALDLGIVFVRRVQLSRAVDSAALAAVVELPDVSAADTTADRFFHTHGFPTVDPSVEPGTGVMDSNWLTVTATLTQSLFFMPVFGFDEVPIPASAVAEYKSPVDMFVSQTGESGVEGVVNLSVFGPDTWTSYGDAFIPLYENDQYDDNENWDVLQGKYTFRITVPPDYPSPLVQIEILDPDCYNAPDPGDDMVEVEYVLTGEKHLRSVSADCSDRRDGCLVRTQDPCQNPTTGEDCNPYWFVRMDENRSRFGEPGSYTADPHNTTTRFSLYYLDENNGRHDIASYTKGGADSDADTDLQWVTPANLRFQLSDYPDVAVAENDSRSFFLEVEPTAGSSENGFDLWAGPVSAYPVPKEVNARNVYLLRYGLDRHDSGGIVITSIGYLPLNVNVDTTFTVTLAYIPPEAAGVYINVDNFDNDCPCGGRCEQALPAPRCGGWGCRGLDFYLEGVPSFHEYGIISTGNQWGENRFQIPENFFGGYLKAVYLTSQYDTSSWRAEYEGVVDNTFVRLIK